MNKREKTENFQWGKNDPEQPEEGEVPGGLQGFLPKGVINEMKKVTPMSEIQKEPKYFTIPHHQQAYEPPNDEKQKGNFQQNKPQVQQAPQKGKKQSPMRQPHQAQNQYGKSQKPGYVRTPPVDMSWHTKRQEMVDLMEILLKSNGNKLGLGIPFRKYSYIMGKQCEDEAEAARFDQSSEPSTHDTGNWGSSQ